MPNEPQPAFPAAVPHTLGNLPYAASVWPAVHGGPANNDYVPVAHGVEFRKEWEALQGMSLLEPRGGLVSLRAVRFAEAD